MTYLTQAQIAMYAAAAGCPNPALAAAIAMAETGGTGNTNAHNPLPPDDSYGLWQINMIGKEGPQRRQQLGLTSNAQLFDPATNARAMMLVSSGGTNFSPWSTYTSGAYQKYMGGGSAQQAGAFGLPDIPGLTSIPGLPKIPGLDPLAPLLGPLDPFGLLNGLGSAGSAASGAADALGWIEKAGEWLSKASNWLRIGYVIGGGALVVVGLGMLAKDTELAAAGGVVNKVVKKIPVGKGSGGK